MLLGNYVDLFNMLGLPETTNVHDMGDAALKVCGDTDVPFPAKDHHTLSQNELCFVAAYAYETFVSGHGFDARVNFTTVTETTYNGATVSVGWQLGAMLYEINALPWSFDAGPNCSVDADTIKHGLFLYTRSSLGGGSVWYAFLGIVVVVLGWCSSAADGTSPDLTLVRGSLAVAAAVAELRHPGVAAAVHEPWGQQSPWNFRKLGTGFSQAAAEQGLGLEAGTHAPDGAPSPWGQTLVMTPFEREGPSAPAGRGSGRSRARDQGVTSLWAALEASAASGGLCARDECCLRRHAASGRRPPGHSAATAATATMSRRAASPPSFFHHLACQSHLFLILVSNGSEALPASLGRVGASWSGELARFMRARGLRAVCEAVGAAAIVRLASASRHRSHLCHRSLFFAIVQRLLLRLDYTLARGPQGHVGAVTSRSMDRIAVQRTHEAKAARRVDCGLPVSKHTKSRPSDARARRPRRETRPRAARLQLISLTI